MNWNYALFRKISSSDLGGKKFGNQIPRSKIRKSGGTKLGKERALIRRGEMDDVKGEKKWGNGETWKWTIQQVREENFRETFCHGVHWAPIARIVSRCRDSSAQKFENDNLQRNNLMTGEWKMKKKNIGEYEKIILQGECSGQIKKMKNVETL